MKVHALGKTALYLIPSLLWADACQASVDSYRYLHVTIETPWFIFLILLPMVLIPLLLMAALVWRYAERKKNEEENQGAGGEGK